MEPIYLFVFTHYPAQNRFALLLELHLERGVADDDDKESKTELPTEKKIRDAMGTGS